MYSMNIIFTLSKQDWSDWGASLKSQINFHDERHHNRNQFTGLQTKSMDWFLYDKVPPS